MKRKKRQLLTAQLAAASFVLLLIAGCQSAPAEPQDEQTDNSSVEIISNGPQQAYLEDGEQQPESDNPPTVPPADTGGHNAEASSLQPERSKQPEGHDQPVLGNGTAPALKGIAIGDSNAEVSDRIGQALDSYVLHEKDPVNVHEYDGFSVGFNRGGNVLFVEVYGEGVASGLGGLKIGDSQKDALQLLGAPEAQTDYLLTYAADGAILRLDVDPATNAIIAMKLLALS